jgi:hypothetical protein
MLQELQKNSFTETFQFLEKKQPNLSFSAMGSKLTAIRLSARGEIKTLIEQLRSRETIHGRLERIEGPWDQQKFNEVFRGILGQGESYATVAKDYCCFTRSKLGNKMVVHHVQRLCEDVS